MIKKDLKFEGVLSAPLSVPVCCLLLLSVANKRWGSASPLGISTLKVKVKGVGRVG